MGIELPKFIVQETEQEKTILRRLLYPVIIVVSFVAGLFGSGYLLNSTNNALSTRNAVLEDLNNENKAIILQQESDLSILKADKKVKTEAGIQLQKEYKASIDVQNSLKSDIDFYQRLLSPNGQNKGLRIFETKVTGTKEKYNLKVTLVQKIERANIISGKFQIEVVGKQSGKQQTININEKENNSYKFKYFHNISLSFSLPEGFNAEQLIVKLFPKNKKAKNIEYNSDWQKIIK